MTKEEVSVTEYFFAGGFGGVCTIIVGHPMDTIKVQLQAMPKPANGQPPKYTGMCDCINKTLKTQGFFGLYKGMGAPLVAVTPIFALSFFGYGLGKQLLQLNNEGELSFFQLFGAGSFSGVFTSFVSTPVERVKCLLQTQASSGRKKYNGNWDCIKKLYMSGGIKSLYKGLFATFLRDIPGAGVYFSIYDGITKILIKNDSSGPSLGLTIVAGGIAGTLNWGFTLPADVLKTQYQIAPDGKYRGVRDVCKELIKREGIRGVYRGAIPTIVRAFPANSACFLGFELAIKVMKYVENNLM